MKQLLIYGNPGVGKTTTCRRLLSTLKGLDASLDFYELMSWGDFKAVVMLHGSRICIYSAGDERQHLRNAIDFSTDWKCEVLVAAVRSRTHYNVPLNGLVCDQDFFWHTLKGSSTLDGTNLNETRMVHTLLNEIFKFIGI